MYENIEALLIALGAACIGIVFTQLGASSVFITIVGTMLIMGAFVIGITAFILFLKDLLFRSGDAD
ncbi:MAG TPA: hypothetical protein VLL74_08445 [Methanoregula sp.]|nr:hypothetical protein [Methanoregula sp.]